MDIAHIEKLNAIMKDLPNNYQVVESKILVDYYNVYDEDENYVGYISIETGEFVPKKDEVP